MNPLFSSFLAWLLRASWQASILTLIVVALQWLFQKQLSPRWRHALWFLVLARLALPLSPSSAASLFNYTRMEKVVARAAPNAPAPKTVAPSVSDTVDRLLHGGAAQKGTRPAIFEISEIHPMPPPVANQAAAHANWFRAENAPNLLALLWAAGLLFFTVRIFCQNMLFLSRLGTPRGVTDPQTLALFANCKAQMGVTAQIRLSETNLVRSPALYGLVRQTLLLPVGMISHFTADELRHIFLHELAHVKRRDMGVLWMVTLCKILHWFNPVLWFGFRRMAADRELACDELALSHASERENGRYGETILKLLEFYARPSGVPCLMGILEDKAQMRRRICMIANFKRRPRWSVLAGVLLLGVGLMTLTDAQTEKPGVSSTQKDQTNGSVANAMRDYQTAIAAYEKDQQLAAKDRQEAAAAVFRLGETYRRLGKTDEANAQYQRIVHEFPEQAEFAGVSQQYLMNLPNPPPSYMLSIGDVAYPGGVAVDSAGYVYVSDTHRDRIRKFTVQGVAVTQWGGRGGDPGSFNYPQGLAADGHNNLYVADVQNERIQKFSSDGTFMRQWGELGTGHGQFHRPYNVAVDKTGNVYVVDSENSRVQKFTSDGLYLKEFGGLGTGLGQLQHPQGVAVDANGNIYVGDGGNGRIEKFSAEGAGLLDWDCGNHDVAVDARGNVYVVAFDCVKMFSSDGTLLTQWGSKGSGIGQFEFAARVAVDPTGSKVFVTDAQNNRVQLFAYPSSAKNK
jgi:beta-lactamase regulating signal transducer with metallopeptidase domain/DNA-binding beta-propeller fold protein YncE